MKATTLLASLTLCVVFLCLAAVNLNPARQNRDLVIQTDFNSVGIKTIKTGGTNDILQSYQGSTLKFGIASNGIPTCVDSGTCVTTGDNTVTQTFARTFSSAPIVVTTQVGINTTSTNTLSITASNFVLGCGTTTKTSRWVALGPL